MAPTNPVVTGAVFHGNKIAKGTHYVVTEAKQAMLDPNNELVQGLVVKLRFFVHVVTSQDEVPVRFQVWRPVNSKEQLYKLAWEKSHPISLPEYDGKTYEVRNANHFIK